MLKIVLKSGEVLDFVFASFSRAMPEIDDSQVIGIEADGDDVAHLVKIVPEYFGNPPGTHFSTRTFLEEGDSELSYNPKEARAILTAIRAAQ